MQMMIVKTLSVQSSVLHGDMGYITFAQLSLRGTRLCELKERKEQYIQEQRSWFWAAQMLIKFA